MNANFDDNGINVMASLVNKKQCFKLKENEKISHCEPLEIIRSGTNGKKKKNKKKSTHLKTRSECDFFMALFPLVSEYVRLELVKCVHM